MAKLLTLFPRVPVATTWMLGIPTSGSTARLTTLLRCLQAILLSEWVPSRIEIAVNHSEVIADNMASLLQEVRQLAHFREVTLCWAAIHTKTRGVLANREHLLRAAATHKSGLLLVDDDVLVEGNTLLKLAQVAESRFCQANGRQLPLFVQGCKLDLANTRGYPDWQATPVAIDRLTTPWLAPTHLPLERTFRHSESLDVVACFALDTGLVALPQVYFSGAAALMRALPAGVALADCSDTLLGAHLLAREGRVGWLVPTAVGWHLPTATHFDTTTLRQRWLERLLLPTLTKTGKHTRLLTQVPFWEQALAATIMAQAFNGSLNFEDWWEFFHGKKKALRLYKWLEQLPPEIGYGESILAQWHALKLYLVS